MAGGGEGGLRRRKRRRLACDASRVIPALRAGIGRSGSGGLQVIGDGARFGGLTP